MTKTAVFSILFSLCISIFNLHAQNETCKLSGEVINRVNSKSLILLTELEDTRTAKGVQIPIVNNRFEYSFTAPYMMRYRLYFDDEINSGSGSCISFFPYNGVVDFKLYSQEEIESGKSRNVINGAGLNKVETNYQQLTDSLFKELNNTADIIFSGKILNSVDSLKLQIKFDSLRQIKTRWECEYIKNNIDEFSYSMIYDKFDLYKINKNEVDIDFLIKIFPKYKKRFPVHPYTIAIQQIINAYTQVIVGNKYPDFEATTLVGKQRNISSIISGKIALIDLWASWCGSCRRLSKSVIPIYEKFKEEGFTVVGIACEFNNTESMKKALEKDKYPWLNLVELDNKNKIWEKYGISRLGGNTFLVDKDGTILAVHPTADELENILSKKIK